MRWEPLRTESSFSMDVLIESKSSSNCSTYSSANRVLVFFGSLMVLRTRHFWSEFQCETG